MFSKLFCTGKYRRMNWWCGSIRADSNFGERMVYGEITDSIEFVQFKHVIKKLGQEDQTARAQKLTIATVSALVIVASLIPTCQKSL